MARTRRFRSPQPRVALVARPLPAGGIAWRARYRNPDTGRISWLTVDPVACSHNQAREEFAKNLSQTIARRRAVIASGAPVLTQTSLAAAAKIYFDAAEVNRRSFHTGTRAQSGARNAWMLRLDQVHDKRWPIGSTWLVKGVSLGTHEKL